MCVSVCVGECMYKPFPFGIQHHLCNPQIHRHGVYYQTGMQTNTHSLTHIELCMRPEFTDWGRIVKKC